MKHLLTTLAAVLLCIGASAQTGKQGTNEFSFNMGYDFGLKKGAGGIITFQPEYGHHFTDNFYLGVGTGLAVDDGFNSYAIPVFLRAEVDFPVGKVTPYISLQGGYDIGVSSGYDGMGRLNPTVGIKVPVSRTTDFNLGFGYTRTFVNGSGFDYLGLKAGVSFNSQGRGFIEFLKKLDYNVELETYTSVSSKDEYNKWTYSGIFGLSLSALGEMPIDNLYAGLNLGIGRYTEKNQFLLHTDNYVDKTSEVYLTAMARARYKVKQLTFAERFYPFVQVGLGIGVNDFAFHPAVGLSMMTGKKESVDLTLGYASINPDDESKSSLRIALGYTF